MRTFVYVDGFNLYYGCRIVTTRNGDDPARFDAEISRQSAALGIRGNVFRLPAVRHGAPENARRTNGRDPSRRIVRVKGKRIVGYAVLATELTAESSCRNAASAAGGGWGAGFLCRFGLDGGVIHVTRLLAKSGQNAPSLAQTLRGCRSSFYCVVRQRR